MSETNPLPDTNTKNLQIKKVESETSGPMDKKAVLEALDFEIKTIQDAQSKNGINHWVLYATLGSFFWLLTSELQAPNIYSFKNALIIFILISLLIDQYKAIQHNFRKGIDLKKIHTYRFKKLERYKKYYLVPILESASWAASLLFLKAEMPGHAFWPFFIYSVLFIVSSMPFVLFLQKFKIFIPPFDRSPITHKITDILFWVCRILIIAISVTGFYSLVFFCIFAFPLIASFTHSDWRIGALIFGTLFVLNNLVSVTDTTAVDSLKEIYRKLNLGLMEPKAAIGQMNIEVAGLTSQEYFRHNILEKFMVHLRDFEFLLEEQKSIYLSLKNLTSSTDQNPEALKALELKIVDYCAEKIKLLEAVKKFQKEALNIGILFQMYKKLHLIDHQTVEEINTSLQKEILRINGIEIDLLKTIKTEVMPAINEHLTQNKIHLSEENRKLLPN